MIATGEIGISNPDPTLIGPRNHRQQTSDGPSEPSVPWFNNSPTVTLRTSEPNVSHPYKVSPRTARGLIIFVGSGLIPMMQLNYALIVFEEGSSGCFCLPLA